LVCSLIMGFAVSVMHYTGMAAVSFTSMTEAPDLTNAVSVSQVATAGIVAVTFVILGSIFLLQRWFAPQNTVQSEG
jgi:NO-binding membrane sensor protein with MHYT domain